MPHFKSRRTGEDLRNVIGPLDTTRCSDAEPASPTDPSVEPQCDCVELINRDLAQSECPNTMVETPLFGPQVAFVVTCKRHERVRGKPKRMFASHCPFCGQKYAEPQPERVSPGSEGSKYSDKGRCSSPAPSPSAAPSVVRLDPRDPDHSREPPFDYHNCARCRSGEKPCVEGRASGCSWLHARND